MREGRIHPGERQDLETSYRNLVTLSDESHPLEAKNISLEWESPLTLGRTTTIGGRFV